VLDLAAIPWKATRHRGVFLHFLHSDSRSGQATVLIRMEPGAAYPGHRHLGDEELLILQGGYEDERGRHREGDYVRYEKGSVHHPRCPADSREACVFFAVAHEGIQTIE